MWKISYLVYKIQFACSCVMSHKYVYLFKIYFYSNAIRLWTARVPAIRPWFFSIWRGTIKYKAWGCIYSKWLLVEIEDASVCKMCNFQVKIHIFLYTFWYIYIHLCQLCMCASMCHSWLMHMDVWYLVTEWW